jgi:transposase
MSQPAARDEQERPPDCDGYKYFFHALAGCGKTRVEPENSLVSTVRTDKKKACGKDEQQWDVFSHISPEQRAPQDHPLRSLRGMTDEALEQLRPRFNSLYAKTGQPSIAPEKLLRALLLQALYSVRSERMLMEQLDYNLLFRWFVGLNMDDSVWEVTVFTKNRERLLEGDIAEAFFQAVLQQAGERSLLSDEHFTVDGTLLEAWASVKSFQRKDASPRLRQTILAMRQWTFTGRGGPTRRMNRRPTRTRS